MSVRVLLAAAAALGLASAAQAADLIVDTAPMAVEPAASDTSIYVQLLGGMVSGLDVQFYEDGDEDGDGYATDAGYAIAGTLGVVVMDGVSLEADMLHTSRNGEEYGDDDTYSTTSLMANAKYTVHLNDTFSVYGAAGLGYIWSTEDYFDSDYDYNGFGYQLIAGVGMQFTDNITGVVEYRFQDSLDNSNYDGDGDYGLSIPNSTVLAGIKIGF